MKVFRMMQLRDAIAHAAGGGQSIHLHNMVFPSSPPCFRRAVAAGESIAHLFDRDEARLRETVRRLGVKVIVVEKVGTPRQHVDICGTPLLRALEMARREEV